jgi:hypothetical protein
MGLKVLQRNFPTLSVFPRSLKNKFALKMVNAIDGEGKFRAEPFIALPGTDLIEKCGEGRAICFSSSGIR